MKFNWQHYLSEQLQWVECLMARANDCDEREERQKLYLLAQTTLRDASHLVGEMSNKETSVHMA
jgi:hypothetical protein